MRLNRWFYLALLLSAASMVLWIAIGYQNYFNPQWWPHGVPNFDLIPPSYAHGREGTPQGDVIAFWGGVFIPAVVVIGLCLLPYLYRRIVAPGQCFPRERRLACWLFIGLLTFMGATTVIGTYFRGPAWALMYWPH